MLPLIVLLCALSSTFAIQLETIYEWNLLTYNTPPEYPVNVSFGGNPITSVEVGFNRIFLAVPRFLAATPATLLYIPHDEVGTNPPLEAYPSWAWHYEGAEVTPNQPHCEGIINVNHLEVDRCGRLWAIDSGNLYEGIPGRRANICPPKLIAFDLRTDQEVKRIEFKELAGESTLTTFRIDQTDDHVTQLDSSCDVGYIYIANSAASSLVVFNMQTASYWIHSDPTFYPDPAYAELRVAGAEPVITMAGITGIALSSPSVGAHRELFYSPLSSVNIYAVKTAALKGAPAPFYLRKLPVRKVTEKSSQSRSLTYDPLTDSLLFSTPNDTSLVSWDLKDNTFSTLSSDPVTMELVLDIRPAILDNNNIWMSSSRLQKSVYNNINPHEINHRVLRISRQPSQFFRNTL